MTAQPSSLARDISPPRLSKRRKNASESTDHGTHVPALAFQPTLAAVEAGKAEIDDHLSYFSLRLAISSRSTPREVPRLGLDDYASLYRSNEHQNGHHFVIHQHNHPKAGVHYDLRLQFSESSSISFAIPKGLPGNPNSKSIGRMAIETRVHNYWNHLIESASSKTGSLLIWETGTYEVLPRRMKNNRQKAILSPHTTDDEHESDSSGGRLESAAEKMGNDSHENDKLIAAFQTRYIRLRLHGTRLPKNYTVILRLPMNELNKRPPERRKTKSKHHKPHQPNADTDSDIERERLTGQDNPGEQDLDTDTDEDMQTRASNAYPGSTNNIGSVHQRHWFLQLDRQGSGFVYDRSESDEAKWVKSSDGGGFDTFLVRGRDFERSVVTGRLAGEVESDEGVEGYKGRAGWVGIEH